jgi:ABC-2 type transport system permease protein
MSTVEARPRHPLRRYLAFATSSLQATLRYRSGLLVSFGTRATSTAVVVFLWRAVFADPDSSPGGFDVDGITTYLIVAQVLAVLHDSQIDNQVGYDIMRGDIAVALTRPVSYPVARVVAALPVVLVNVVLVGVPVLLLFTILFPVTVPDPVDLLLFLAATVPSVAIAFSLSMLVGFCGMVTTNIWGVRMVKESVVAFLAGQLAPIDLMPGPLAAVASALPFQGMIYAPVRLLTGRFTGPGDAAGILLGQVAWAVVLIGLNAAVWRVFLRRLQVSGG